jgi:tol-pal system protein YbgF
MQQEMRLLTGRIEEIEYLLNRKLGDFEAAGGKREERMDEVSLTLAKIDQRLIALERYLSMDRNAPAGQVAKEPPAAGNLYDTAKKAYDKGEWEKARQLFIQLLKNDPQSENADNAQFWIGETYYNEQWFEKAILEYQTVIEQYPKGNKVPAAMLKQGLAFLKLGDQSNARLVLKRLAETYPKSNEASIAQARLKEI